MIYFEVNRFSFNNLHLALRVCLAANLCHADLKTQF